MSIPHTHQRKKAHTQANTKGQNVSLKMQWIFIMIDSNQTIKSEFQQNQGSTCTTFLFKVYTPDSLIGTVTTFKILQYQNSSLNNIVKTF